MPEIIINGIPVNFPYPNPYTVQKTYMEKVIECLTSSKNGVLESPTGTGKTLSLLCSSLAWLEWKKIEIEAPNQSRSEDDSFSPLTSKIIYASRTHTQLTQAINELKGTDYRYMKVAVLASRNQLCIHPDLRYETNENKTLKCKSKIKTIIKTEVLSTDECGERKQSMCSFYDGYENLKNDDEFRDSVDKILDIEELVSEGRLKKFCPYFMSKEVLKLADIIFMPYNYLLDAKICQCIDVDLNDAVVILDEAHNVPQRCEDASSIEFKSSHIVTALMEVQQISELCSIDKPKTFQASELEYLKGFLQRFKNAIDEIHLPNLLSGKEFDGDFIFMLMDKADIEFHNAKNIDLLIRNTLEYLTDYTEKSGTAQVLRGTGLRKFNEILWTVFSQCGEEFRNDIKKHYRVYIEWEKVVLVESQMVQTSGPVKIVHFWCFSPKFGLEYLLKKKHVRCIIFTSGTMSPLQPFVTSLGIPIEVTLQNSHIIDKSQVLVKIISNGSDKETLSSSYHNRSNPKYLNSLGSTILSFCPVIPHGLLVFFPSYIILNMCTNQWKDSGIWQQINSFKPIFVESQSKEEFDSTMKNYYKKISEPNTKGAIFMAVCRGKVSEGLDFTDNNGRGVIITGLPFPPFTDPKIRLKRMYMQDNSTENDSLDGDQWYSIEASRAVNQAIGRVIRHRNDYGAILLCDCRFENQRQKSQLSSWIQKHLRTSHSSKSFGMTINSISKFFKVQLQGTAPLTIQNSNQNPQTPKKSIQMNIDSAHNDDQLTTSNVLVKTPESPLIACIKRISSLPLSSPPSSNTRNVDNLSPQKRKCNVNLCQRFDD